MSLLGILLIVWGIVTGGLIVLMIYRSIVGMREDDQLFLSKAEAQMERAQREVIDKLTRTEPYLKWLGATSALLMAVIAGIWVYQGMTQGTVR